MGIDADRLTGKTIKLVEEDFLRAGNIVSKNSQFLSDPLNLPAFASSPSGKVLTQYKNFAYNQTRFINRQLRDPNISIAKKTRTVLIISMLFPMSGEVTSDIRSIITGRQRPTKVWDRYLENIMNAGAFGLAGDLWVSAKYSSFIESLAGPTLTSTGKLVEAHYQTISQGKIDPAAKEWLEQTGVGRVVANRIWQKKVRGRGGVFEFWQEL